MKKFSHLFLLFVIYFFTFFQSVSAQAVRNAVLLLSTDNPQTMVGNTSYYDLVLNTLGNQVNEIDVEFLVRGPFDRQSLTFNLHPEHKNRVQVSSPLSVIDYHQIFENEDGVRVRVIMRTSDGKPFNEGSGAIPVFRVGLRASSAGTISGYIDSSHSYVRYTDSAKNGYDNYNTESRPKTLIVVGDAVISVTNAPVVATSTPTRTPTHTPTPTAKPSAMPTSSYDKEFEKVQGEIEQLKSKVENQEKRVSLLEKFMQSLKNFFTGLFK